MTSLPTDGLLYRDSSGSTPIWRIDEKALPPNPTPKGVKRLSFAAKVFTWMETYAKIRTKEGDVVTFRLNTVQRILAQYVASCWFKGVSVRLVTPKSRQQGSSTFWQVFFTTLCELKKGYHIALVAHVEDSAEDIFAKVHTVKREVANTDWGQFDLIGDQAGSIEWAHESSSAAATIKSGDALGRGPSLNAIHFSESASYSDRGTDARGGVKSIKASMAETWLTVEVHESTAKGKDPFFWPLCETARDPSSGSTYHLIFLPWFISQEYSMSWEHYRKELLEKDKDDPGEKFQTTAEERQLRRQLAETVVGPKEKHHRYRHYLTDDQLVWRRWAITNICWNDLDSFKREFPSTYEEAFTASAKAFFDAETIEWYRAKSQEPIAKGFVTDSSKGPAFMVETGGPVKIWEFPRPGAEYVTAADPGGSRPDSDPNCCYVFNKATLEMVAQLHGHFEWDHFIDHVYELALFYNKSLLVVENNHNPASANRCHRRNYPNLYYFFEDATIEAEHGKKPGFNTNRKTRPEILNIVKKVLRDRTATVPDPDFWREMETFVWVPKTISNPDGDGEWRALKPNHDDRILTAAIALLQCPLVEPELREREIVEKPSRAYLMHLELERDRKAEESTRAGSFLNLSAPRKIPGVARSVSMPDGTWRG